MKTDSLVQTIRLLRPLLGLLLMAAIPTNAADVLFYAVQKSQLFVQSTPDAPQLAPDNPFVFEVFVEGSGQGQIDGADLTRPGGAATRISGDGFSFHAQSVFASLGELNSVYRNGTYRFDFDTENDFFPSATLSLSGDTYPPAPHVANYTTAQAVNPASAFPVRWDPFTGGTFDDIVELYVYDNTDAVVYTDSGLDGTATSDTIPANTLRPGTTYPAEVIFRKSVDFEAVEYDGAFGFSFYSKTTRFTIATTGAASNPAPTMSNPLLQPAGQFRFHIDGVAGRLYRVESTTDFGSWAPVDTITAPAGGGFDFVDNQTPSVNSRFYRAVLLP